MYIIKNAFICIVRAKGRNFLIGAVVLLLSVSSCIGLSIKQANKTLKKQYADDMEISATLNPANMRENGNISLDTLKELSQNDLVKNFYYSSSLYFAAGDNIEPLDVAGSFKQNKDFRDEYGDIRNGHETTSSVTNESTSANFSYEIKNLSAASLQTASEPEKQIDSSEQTTGEDDNKEETERDNDEKQDSNPEFQPPQKPDNTENQEQNDSANQNSNEQKQPDGIPNMPNERGGDTFITNKFFFNMASMNDFTVIGFSSEDAIPEYISSLGVLETESDLLNCVISKNLADENEFKTGDSFTLKNPDNEDETYTFTIAGICDTSQSGDSQNTSSNASFTDNYIYISSAALDKILSDSAKTNTASDDSDSKTNALTATHSGTFIFANLENYNNFSELLDDSYRIISEDVTNYEQSISQLETLGKYATYFLIVIFIIGAFVLIIINLFSIRNRKYEIGVLTAIGMKKYKVALQFVIELFIVTFAALIIGSAIGAATSVPVTNSLLVSINSEEKSNNATEMLDGQAPEFSEGSGDRPNRGEMGQGFKDRIGAFGKDMNNYIAEVSSATDITVILQMILVGMGLTLISSAAAVAFVMRYEPLKILNNRD